MLVHRLCKFRFSQYIALRNEVYSFIDKTLASEVGLKQFDEKKLGVRILVTHFQSTVTSQGPVLCYKITSSFPLASSVSGLTEFA
jgi:hypothetical protein